ncbi:MAG: putative ATP-binding protein [Candidatus Methanogaster sp.]|nr:MAG: putative ATP-binding protein [ANME-2 cluster archaeon]
MKRIEFHNREKEMKEIIDVLDAEPSLITFVYGPINSGKTTLITHLIEELSEDYVVFYINLRTKLLASYDDFIESLFEMEMETGGALKKKKETLAELVSSVTKVAGIPITKEFIDYVFKDNKPKNAFSYILKLFEEVIHSGKQPVLVLDELQKIGDVKVNGPLIYELFNFFIDLTKEKHLAHVFAVTSDSLFIEQVYSEAMLEGRCRYLLVDDFDYETISLFVSKYGLNDRERETAWDYCGGKPVCLVELVNTKLSGGDVVTKTESLLEEAVSRLIFMLARNKEKKSDIVEMLSIFASDEEVKYSDSINLDSMSFLVKQNILFLDPVKRMIKPQSRLNMLAIREVITNA